MLGLTELAKCIQLLSRVKTHEGLYLIKEFRRETIKVNTDVIQEMQRLSSTKLLKVHTLQVPRIPDIFLNLSLLNINSLKPHFECLCSEENIHTSDIVFLTEAWLQSNHCDETYELGPNYQIYRQDRKPVRSNLNPHGAVAIPVDHKFHVKHQFQTNTSAFDCLATLLEHRSTLHRIMVVCVYNSPRTNQKTFLHDFDRVLSSLPVHNGPTLLAGDFNVNNR